MACRHFIRFIHFSSFFLCEGISSPSVFHNDHYSYITYHFQILLRNAGSNVFSLVGEISVILNKYHNMFKDCKSNDQLSLIGVSRNLTMHLAS